MLTGNRIQLYNGKTGTNKTGANKLIEADRMRYRLTTILLITALIAVPLGVWRAWRYQQWKTLIPVKHVTEVTSYTFVPKLIQVRYGDQAHEWLKAGEEKQTATRNAPREKVTVATVIAEPYDYQSVDDENVDEYVLDPDQMVPALLAALQKPPPADEESNHGSRFDRIKYAEMLVKFGRPRVAFDWAVNELTNGKYRDGEELSLMYYYLGPLQKEIENPWQFIRPYVVLEEGDRPWSMEAEEFCMQNCKEEFVDWCYENLNNQELSWEKRNRCWLVVVDELPTSLDLLKAAKCLFFDLQGSDRNATLTSDGHTALFRVAEKLPTKECHALIATYAYQRLKEYGDDTCETAWAKYADASWQPIIEQRAINGSAAALKALSRLQGELSNEFLFENAQLEKPLCDRALWTLVTRFQGTGDKRIIDLLTQRFHHTGQARDSWLRALRRVGGLDRARELREQWEREEPSSYFNEGRRMHDNGLTLDDLIATFQAAGYAKQLTAEQVRAEILDSGEADHPDFIRPGQELEMALKMAKLKHSVFASESAVGSQLMSFSKLTQGELHLENISVHEEFFRFGWKDKAFQCRLLKDEFSFDGIAMANLLNAILERFGHRNRFFAYASYDVDLFFGDPRFARELHDRFGVKWRTGAEAYWAD